MPQDNRNPSTAPSAAQGAAATARIAEEMDAEIEALDLSDTARQAAYLLKRKHPSVRFTSGRRDKNAQASAMASNVVSNRRWIHETYVPSEVRDLCQKWVDDHPDQRTKEAITLGLKSVFDSVTDSQLARISKHLSGSAFDVQPVEAGAAEIKETIRGLPGLDKFLEREGGLVRWHAQF
jgi:hypothetical protein